MSRAPSFCGVILSAGASTRMGRDKALLPWPVTPRPDIAVIPRPAVARPAVPGPANNRPGGTFLSAAIRLLSAETDLVIVVAGSNAPQLELVAYAEGAFLVRNPHPELGQFSSLRVGLQEVLHRGRDAAVVTLVDRPPVQPATLHALLAGFGSAIQRNKWAVVPECNGRHGHPIVAGREMMEAFLRAPAGSNAREVRHANQEFIEYVPVDDPFVTMNVDTPEDYAALTGFAPVSGEV